MSTQLKAAGLLSVSETTGIAHKYVTSMSRGLSQLDIITLDDELRSLDEFCAIWVATALLYVHAIGVLPGAPCDNFARLVGTTSHESKRQCTVLGRGRYVGREQVDAPALGAKAHVHCLSHPDPVGGYAPIGYICLRVILEPSLDPRRPDRQQVLAQLFYACSISNIRHVM